MSCYAVNLSELETKIIGEYKEFSGSENNRFSGMLIIELVLILQRFIELSSHILQRRLVRKYVSLSIKQL